MSKGAGERFHFAPFMHIRYNEGIYVRLHPIKREEGGLRNAKGRWQASCPKQKGTS